MLLNFPSHERIEEMKRRTPEVLEKWRKTGLLENVEKDQEIIVAWLLENQEEKCKSKTLPPE